jgi:hypothetical protein
MEVGCYDSVRCVDIVNSKLSLNVFVFFCVRFLEQKNSIVHPRIRGGFRVNFNTKDANGAFWYEVSTEPDVAAVLHVLGTALNTDADKLDLIVAGQAVHYRTDICALLRYCRNRIAFVAIRRFPRVSVLDDDNCGTPPPPILADLQTRRRSRSQDSNEDACKQLFNLGI